jgi:DNA polymerase-3 subunit delta'
MRFSEVIGQQIVKKRMVDGVRSGRIAHAQLILGAEGSGNLALALAYAQYVLCDDPSETDSCGECSSCKKVSSGIHPDVHFSFPFPNKKGEMEQCSDVYPQWREAIQEDPYMNYEDWMQQLNAENKQGNIPTKELRNILKNISLKSYEGKMKICLIWLPEYLGQEGNILLKSLEEPPAQTLFLLVGGELDAILGTILSRTQTIRVAPIEDHDLAEALILREAMPADDAHRLAKVAQGNYRLARELGREAGNPHLDAWRTWMTICFRRKMGEAFQWSDDTAALGREGVKSFLLFGIQVLRTCAILPYTGAEGLWEGPELDFVNKFNTLQLGEGVIGEMVVVLEKTIYGMERNGNAKVLLLDATYGMIQAISKKN